VDKAQRIYLGNEPSTFISSVYGLSRIEKQAGRCLPASMKRSLRQLAAVVTARQSGINNISIVTEPITNRRALKSMTTAVANPQARASGSSSIYSIIMHTSVALVIAVRLYSFRRESLGGIEVNSAHESESVSAAGIPHAKRKRSSPRASRGSTKGLYKKNRQNHLTQDRRHENPQV